MKARKSFGECDEYLPILNHCPPPIYVLGPPTPQSVMPCKTSHDFSPHLLWVWDPGDAVTPLWRLTERLSISCGTGPCTHSLTGASLRQPLSRFEQNRGLELLIDQPVCGCDWLKGIICSGVRFFVGIINTNLWSYYFYVTFSEVVNVLSCLGQTVRYARKSIDMDHQTGSELSSWSWQIHRENFRLPPFNSSCFFCVI